MTEAPDFCFHVAAALGACSGIFLGVTRCLPLSWFMLLCLHSEAQGLDTSPRDLSIAV